jgi:hypothetical protein
LLGEVKRCSVLANQLVIRRLQVHLVLCLCPCGYLLLRPATAAGGTAAAGPAVAASEGLDLALRQRITASVTCCRSYCGCRTIQRALVLQASCCGLSAVQCLHIESCTACASNALLQMQLCLRD